jgi:2-oxoglutarate/2-oxoacid ferredoxin oxidoreductase subunit alpha
MTNKKVLMKGNEAFALAAIKSGCKYYFGYPITPQNEIPEYMSHELKKSGGSFVQAESEIAAINMAYGAGAAGGRVMITSSSPGIALMQEGISFLCSVEVPCVIINVSRGGPGIGTILPGQSDYYQSTRGGGNGDYHLIVYAPASIQESVELIMKAFELSDSYRNPILILVDGMIGQMMEPVLFPEENKMTNIDKPWALTGTKGERIHNVIKSVHLQAEELENWNTHLAKKYKIIKDKEVLYEEINTQNADIVFVAYGTTSRIVKEAMETLKEQGINTGIIRPITLWPFPYEALEKLSGDVKAVISVELSQGQMVDDVRLGVNGKIPVHFVGRCGGIVISSSEVVDFAKSILGVK